MIETKLKEAELMEMILRWTIKNVSGATFEEPAFALCIAYSLAGEGFPGPAIGIGLESERQKLAVHLLTQKSIERWGDMALETFYNPAHYKNFDVAALYKDRDEIEFLGESLDSERFLWDNFYFDLGLELAKTDWSLYLKITPDFVVFTTDVERSVWEKNFMASVLQNGRKKLFKDGWLPSKMAE